MTEVSFEKMFPGADRIGHVKESVTGEITVTSQMSRLMEAALAFQRSNELLEKAAAKFEEAVTEFYRGWPGAPMPEEAAPALAFRLRESEDENNKLRNQYAGLETLRRAQEDAVLGLNRQIACLAAQNLELMERIKGAEKKAPAKQSRSAAAKPSRRNAKCRRRA